MTTHTEPIRIDTIEQLQEVAAQLGVRPDWHEPDEQKVTARFRGRIFDNAGHWPRSRNHDVCPIPSQIVEQYIELIQDGTVVAQVNLATLFAMAARGI
jgi:hypothetical protein